MQRIYLFVLFLLPTFSVFGQVEEAEEFTISGYVRDGQTGEELIGASVFEPQSGGRRCDQSLWFLFIDPAYRDVPIGVRLPRLRNPENGD